MKTTDDKGLPMPLKIAAAGLAGCTADVATFPFDTIKVWLQVRGEGGGKAAEVKSSTAAPKLPGQMPGIALSQPRQTRGVQISATALADLPKTMSSGAKEGLKRSLLARLMPLGSPGKVRGNATISFTEMTASEMYMLKKKAMGQYRVPPVHIDNAVSAAVKFKANATQTFNELTMSELYMAQKRAALSAARMSKKATTGAFQTIIANVKKSGVRSLYSGLNAGLQRQIGFCSVRIGFYDNIKQFYTTLIPGAPDGKMIAQKILAGATSGFLAVCLFQPTEVVKIRMQAEKGRYRGTFHAYRSLFKAGGIAETWKGFETNCARMAIVNTCELVTYDVVKESILRRKLMSDNLPCHITSALISGIVTTVVANPIDVVKTRYMNSDKGTYKNPIQCAASTLHSEGVTAFYKGFLPSYLRIGLWNLIMFVTYEQYKKFFKDIASSTPEFPLAHLGTAAPLIPINETEADGVNYPSYVEAIFDSHNDSGPMS